MPDGSIAPVSIDFGVIRELSSLSRERYGLAGAVQHGASTLPDDAFHRFPEAETAEIHLATGFQNMVLDHPQFPPELRRELHGWLHAECASEMKSGQTEEQFLYKTRKKVFGPFKRTLWSLPAETLGALGRDLEEKFAFYFGKLGVAKTRELVLSRIARADVPLQRPSSTGPGAELHAEKDLPASELAD